MTEERAARAARSEKWIPYYSLLAEKQKDAPFDVSSDPFGFISTLLREGFVRPGSSVLDVGAGTGSYALGFASREMDVTALELCPACADLMEERARRIGVGLRVVRGAWESFACDEAREPAGSPASAGGSAAPAAYDMVFASMCPAICDEDEIRRMEGISKGACCLVSVLPGSYDRHRKTMMGELGIKPEGMIVSAGRFEEMLRGMGRVPFKVTAERRSESLVSLEELLERYPVYFGIFGVDAGASEDFIRSYFERNAQDGFLHDESYIKAELLAWKTN